MHNTLILIGTHYIHSFLPMNITKQQYKIYKMALFHRLLCKICQLKNDYFERLLSVYSLVSSSIKCMVLCMASSPSKDACYVKCIAVDEKYQRKGYW